MVYIIGIIYHLGLNCYLNSSNILQITSDYVFQVLKRFRFEIFTLRHEKKKK